jgi:hypothetical protein
MSRAPKGETRSDLVNLYALLYRNGPMMVEDIAAEYPQSSRSHAYDLWFKFEEYERVRSQGAYMPLAPPTTQAEKDKAWLWWINTILTEANADQLVRPMWEYQDHASDPTRDNGVIAGQLASDPTRDNGVIAGRKGRVVGKRIRSQLPFVVGKRRPWVIKSEIRNTIVPWTPDYEQLSSSAKRFDFVRQARERLAQDGRKVSTADWKAVVRLGLASHGFEGE